MRRIVFIWLPHFALERYLQTQNQQQIFSPCSGAPEPHAFALVEKNAKGLEITAVNDMAAHEGISPGQMLPDARSICPALKTAPAEPEQDVKALKELAYWCLRYSPLVAPVGRDGIAIDSTGCAHLFGGEMAMARDIIKRLSQLGLTARLGLADTLGAAYALSCFSKATSLEPRISPPKSISVVTADLPVVALRLSSATTLLLQRLGLKTIGQLKAIPRTALASRFGARDCLENVCLRLDQLSGARAEPLNPLECPPACQARLIFAEPLIDSIALEHTLDPLLTKLIRQLEDTDEGARQIRFTACRVDGSIRSLNVKLSRPNRNAGHIRRLLIERLEQIDPGFGIDALLLDAVQTQSLTPLQNGLDNTVQKTPEDTALLVDRLANRIGPQNIHRLTPVESHMPERAQQPAVVGKSPEWPSLPTKHARPFRLLPRPEAITAIAEVPDGPPMQFTWRRITRRVAKARGPERIASEWWLHSNRIDQSDTRDYYEVEDTQGRRYWLYREGLFQDPARRGPPGWFMHGLFA